jgi:quinohemoprotein ethanol dehydrogenase
MVRRDDKNGKDGRGMKRGAWMTAIAALAIGGSSYLGAKAPALSPLDDRSGGTDWAGYGRTFGEQHFSPLAQVNAGNVGKLGLVWSLDLGAGNSVTTPLEVGGTLYFATGYSIVHAVDAVSGKVLWTYNPKAPQAAGHKLRQGWGIRGIAWWNGKIYVGTHDGRLIAIDAKTGQEVWTAQTYAPEDARYITGAPRVFDGMVIIGHGGADVGAIRGYVTTYDAETGKQIWRWYTVPGDPSKGFENEAMEKAAKTWTGEWWKYGGGGTVWNAMAYDQDTDTIILGTGNGSPWNAKVRSPQGGDNLYLCSIVGLDAKTGQYKWHYQTNPAETWDYNAAMDIELADLTIDGQRRKVLMTAPKNGFLYVIDRTNGKLISAKPYVKTTWAKEIDLATGRPIEDPADHFPNGSSFEMWPSPSGSHSWQPMAFSPKTGLVYIPAIEKGAIYSDAPGLADESWRKDVPDMGLLAALNMDFFTKLKDPRDGTAALIAWDPVRQKEVWRQPNPSFLPGSVMATAGNLVFQGSIDGQFHAYAADSGKPLWSFPAQAAVLAAPISYSVNGRQYVTVLSGMGLSGGASGSKLTDYKLDYRSQKRRVLTFALGGTQKLPASPRIRLVAAPDAAYRRDTTAATRGALVFGYRCSICHGADAVAAGTAPDLRTSSVPMSAESLDAVVRGGALVPNGMPRFAEMTEEQLADLREYLRSRAADLREGVKN